MYPVLAAQGLVFGVCVADERPVRPSPDQAQRPSQGQQEGPFAVLELQQLIGAQVPDAASHILM